MSMFLGSIHYWLYGKIGKQEALTEKIAKLAKSCGWINDSEVYTKTLPPLEKVIDENNIHGWLQACITDAETRYADLVGTVLLQDEKRISKLCSAAYEFGEQNALPSDTNAQKAYEEFENFFVNGMPCDRVNMVIKEENGELTWEQTCDIHEPYWIPFGGTGNYYIIRKSVMDGMLSAASLKVIMTDDNRYVITNK